MFELKGPDGLPKLNVPKLALSDPLRSGMLFLGEEKHFYFVVELETLGGLEPLEVVALPSGAWLTGGF